MPPARRRRFAPWLASALAVAAVIPGSAAAADVWGASVNDKVFPHSVRPADAAPEVALAAARDEYEGAFAAVRADATVTVEPKISDLTGLGVIPASSVELEVPKRLALRNCELP